LFYGYAFRPRNGERNPLYTTLTATKKDVILSKLNTLINYHWKPLTESIKGSGAVNRPVPSGLYEFSNVLFNLGVAELNEAHELMNKDQDKSTSRKLAFQMCREAAGTFSYLETLVKPFERVDYIPFDLKQAKVFSLLALLQAQEIAIQLSIDTHKNIETIIGLSQHASILANQARTLWKSADSMTQNAFWKALNSYFAYKFLYYQLQARFAHLEKIKEVTNTSTAYQECVKLQRESQTLHNINATFQASYYRKSGKAKMEAQIAYFEDQIKRKLEQLKFISQNMGSRERTMNAPDMVKPIAYAKETPFNLAIGTYWSLKDYNLMTVPIPETTLEGDIVQQNDDEVDSGPTIDPNKAKVFDYRSI